MCTHTRTYNNFAFVNFSMTYVCHQLKTPSSHHFFLLKIILQKFHICLQCILIISTPLLLIKTPWPPPRHLPPNFMSPLLNVTQGVQLVLLLIGEELHICQKPQSQRKLAPCFLAEPHFCGASGVPPPRWSCNWHGYTGNHICCEFLCARAVPFPESSICIACPQSQALFILSTPLFLKHSLSLRLGWEWEGSTQIYHLWLSTCRHLFSAF